MGSRSLNYIALSPEITLSPAVAKYLGRYVEISDDRGDLFVFETNITPMWARDTQGEHCTADLEEELEIQRFLGSIPKELFYMKRAGEECGHRGRWDNHPFSNEPSVMAIDESYQDASVSDDE